MRNVSEKNFWENLKQTVYFLRHIFFEIRAFCEIRQKNIVEPGRPQSTTWCMRIACWVPRATNTHPECVILIAFPLQQWLHGHSSMLSYVHIAFLLTLEGPVLFKDPVRTAQ